MSVISDCHLRHAAPCTYCTPLPLEQRDTVKERTPPKLSKLEHVALNSASETGAKIHQNTQICK